MKEIVAIFFALLVHCPADTLISGFGPGENPFAYSGFFGSLIQNSDGTQTLFQDPSTRGFWSIYLQPGRLDVTDGGNNNAVSLRAKREPDHVAGEDFVLSFASSGQKPSGQADTRIRYDQFPIGSFGTITVPFNVFVVGGATPFYGVTQITMTDSSLNGRSSTTHFAFDYLVAVQIPEPSTLVLVSLGFAVLLCIRRRSSIDLR